LSQDYPALEYLVIDGNSSDGSRQIIEQYAARLAFWISEPDRNHYEAVNKGLARARGEIMAYLCSDDTYEPEALLYVGRYFLEHPDCNLLVGGYNYIDANDRLLWTAYGEFNKDELICMAGNLGQPAVFWRRRVYERLGGFMTDSNYHRDLEFFLRCGGQFKFHHTKTILANYRTHINSHSSKQPPEMHQEQIKILKMYGGFYPGSLKQKLTHPAYLGGKIKWQIRKAVAMLRTGYFIPHMKMVIERYLCMR
jgi:glycosyltransferase involved in cell wall biosynthesis